MDGDSLGILHSRAERYVRNLESAPDRWHFDGSTIYLINGDRIESVPFTEEGVGEMRVWASEDDDDVVALSAFLNINDTDRMPLEEDNINSQYRVAISLVPDYLIVDDQQRALQDVTAFMIYLSQNGYDPTTVGVMFDVEHNEIDLVGNSDFDYHQMVMLHDDLNRLMEDAPMGGYVYAIFTAPGIAEDFYPMTYGYPAARQAMMARLFEAEDRVFASAVRVGDTKGIVERVMALQKALDASEMQERMIRVQYGVKNGLISGPEEALAILAGIDDIRGAETDPKTDFGTPIRVGDTVRSYDFPFGSDTSCYVEGVVARIAPAPPDVCPCGFDHYHIVTQRRVFNDKETSDFAEAYFPVADPAQTRVEVVESKGAESSDPCPVCKEPADQWEDSDRCGKCDKTVCSGCIEEGGDCVECTETKMCPSNYERVYQEIVDDLGQDVVFAHEDEYAEHHMDYAGQLVNASIADAINDGEYYEPWIVQLRQVPQGCVTEASYDASTEPLTEQDLYLIQNHCAAHGIEMQRFLEDGCVILIGDDPTFFYPPRDQIAIDLWEGADDDVHTIIAQSGVVTDFDDDGDDNDEVFEAPRGRPKGSGKGNYTCGRCGKSGHNARTCDQPESPKPLKPKPRSGGMRPSKTQQENLPSYRCSNCGVRGHNKTKCPEPVRVEFVDPRILDDFEKWKSGESKMQTTGRIKRNIIRILQDEPNGLGREQFIERYKLNTGTQSKQRKEVSRLTRLANNMTSDVILWRDRYYALGDGGKEAFFKTGPGSLRG